MTDDIKRHVGDAINQERQPLIRIGARRRIPRIACRVAFKGAALMDAAKQRAIAACGQCGQPEDAHKFSGDETTGDLVLFAALGGPCPRFVASDAAVIYQKHLAITNNRAPARRQAGAPIGKRPPLCTRCLNRGHQAKDCPL